MGAGDQREDVFDLEKFTSWKDRWCEPRIGNTLDSLSAWAGRFLELAVVGVRSRTVAEKAALILGRFVEFKDSQGHDRTSTVVRRALQGWRRSLAERGLAPSTVNHHLASLSPAIYSYRWFARLALFIDGAARLRCIRGPG